MFCGLILTQQVAQFELKVNVPSSDVLREVSIWQRLRVYVPA